MSRASLSGQLPTQVGRLTTLITLDASTNHLSPSVPAFLGALPRLQTLYLNGNWFLQPLAPNLFRATQLRRL